MHVLTHVHPAVCVDHDGTLNSNSVKKKTLSKPLTQHKYESVYIFKGKILARWVPLQTTDNHVLSKSSK